MKKVVMVFVVFTVFTSIAAAQLSNSQNAVHALQRFQQRADNFYNIGFYRNALRDYKILARYSDKHSQYRLAEMYLNGQGVEKELVEAYAWSYLASESRRPEYVEYHKFIHRQMDEKKLEQGKLRVKEYLDKYSLFSVAVKAREFIRQEKRNCTGSRVGSCDRAEVASSNCSMNIGSSPSASCLHLGAIGLPSIAGMLPSDLRTVENALELIIAEYNPGLVELRDIEVIED